MGQEEILLEKLVVGAKIRFGKKFAQENSWTTEGHIVELVQGHFEVDHSDFPVTETAPSVWNENEKDFDSIYHLFGNDLENFMDCQII